MGNINNCFITQQKKTSQYDLLVSLRENQNMKKTKIFKKRVNIKTFLDEGNFFKI